MIFTIALLFSHFAQADQCIAAAKQDDFEAYLVTSGPGHGMYTRVGHSAIWVSGGNRNEVFFNWGAYDSDQENFLWKFFMGTANYKLTLMTEKRNTRRIKKEDQMLKAQHLNLSPEMKSALLLSLDNNARPENRLYTYHWEQQNCATMIRDIVDDITGGAFQSTKNQDSNITVRHEVLRHLSSLPWAWFGWDFMASSYAEKKYNRWDLMHIPERLMEQVGETEVTWEDGSIHPLVDKECILNEGSFGWTASEPPTLWPYFWGIGILLGALFSVGRYSDRRSVQRLSSIAMALHYTFGSILGSSFLYLWLFSSLEGYGPNENWFYASPLTFLILPYLRWPKHPILSKIPIFLSIVAVFGILINPFTTQVNSNFIGLFGFPLLIFTVHAHFKKQ